MWEDTGEHTEEVQGRKVAGEGMQQQLLGRRAETVGIRETEEDGAGLAVDEEGREGLLDSLGLEAGGEGSEGSLGNLAMMEGEEKGGEKEGGRKQM